MAQKLSCALPAALLLLSATVSSAADRPPVPVRAPAPGAVTGLIERDTVWTGAVSVVGKVQVLSGSTLTIEPGTQVRFAVPPTRRDTEEDRLFVQAGGRILARGTPSQPIVFSSATPGVRWFGIELHSKHDRDAFAHCRIRDSRFGIACVSTSPTVENTVFEHNERGVSLWRQSKPVIRNCRFFRNAMAVVVAMQSAATVTACEIEESGEAGVSVEPGSGGVVEKTRLARNRIGIQKRGPGSLLVSGNHLASNATGVSVDHEGAVPELRENVFVENRQGVIAATRASPRISRNRFAANDTAVGFDSRSRGLVDHNDLTANGVGVRISRTSRPEITWNQFSNNGTAVICEYSSYPTIANNNFQSNGTAVHAGDHQSFEWTRSVWKEDEWERWALSYGRDKIVARDNYWGEETTREMEAGSRPIGSIFDYHKSQDLVIEGKSYRRDEVDYRPFRAAPIPTAGSAPEVRAQ